MKSSMPPQAEVLTITVDDFRAQQAEEIANDVFLQAEQILRSLGDTGGEERWPGSSRRCTVKVG